jgi:hypothetical protein
MDEVFLFEKEIRDGEHIHTVLVSETMDSNIPVVYNCIVDIHTNIQIEHNGNEWIEKDKGSTTFSTMIGTAIEAFIKQKN